MSVKHNACSTSRNLIDQVAVVNSELARVINYIVYPLVTSYSISLARRPNETTSGSTNLSH